MKKNLLFSLIAGTVLLFASCKSKDKPADSVEVTAEAASDAAPDVQHRYSMKSAKVTTTMKMPGGMGTSNTILYFDDYGEKEMRESVTAFSFGGKSMNKTNRTIIQDGYIYTWEVGQKTGSKIKMDASANPGDIDYKKLTAEMKAKFKMKDEGTAEVLNKTCKVFSYEMEGMKGKSYVWENIPMKTEMMIAGQAAVAEVTDLQEGVSIPASEFEVPADVEFKELSVGKNMHP